MEDFMPQPTAILFYVGDPAKSSAFYEELLGRKPAMTSPYYAMFKLDNGFELALWALSKVDPPPPPQIASSELGFTVADKAALESLHRQWVEKGIPIALAPKKRYFGGSQ